MHRDSSLRMTAGRCAAREVQKPAQNELVHLFARKIRVEGLKLFRSSRSYGSKVGRQRS